MPSPALFPAPYGPTIRVWEGLYRLEQSGWRCDPNARVAYGYTSGCVMLAYQPEALYTFNGREKYVELSTVHVTPYLWAGIWFLAADGAWYLHRSWTNRYQGGDPWGREPL